MSTSQPHDRDPVDDIAQVLDDDALLDALARGDNPSGELEGLLADLRDYAGVHGGGEREQRAAVVELLPEGVRAARRVRRWRRRLMAAAAVGIVSAGMVTAVDHAGPGSPLFPATRVLFPDEAAERAVEQIIDDAYAAADAGRYRDAWRLTFDAEDELTQVDDPATAAELHGRIYALRQRPGMVAAIVGPVPAVTVPAPPGAVHSGPSVSPPEQEPRTSAPAPSPATPKRAPSPPSIGGTVGGVVDGVGETVEGIVGGAGKATGGAVDGAGDTAGDLVGGADDSPSGEAVDGTGEQAGDRVDDATDAAGDLVDDASDAAGDLLDGVLSGGDGTRIPVAPALSYAVTYRAFSAAACRASSSSSALAVDR